MGAFDHLVDSAATRGIRIGLAVGDRELVPGTDHEHFRPLSHVTAQIGGAKFREHIIGRDLDAAAARLGKRLA
jgi:hypothetical protein